MLPVLRWSSPVEAERLAAVKQWKRVIDITARLGVDLINTEFSGRPELQEESERAFYESMEELLPLFEREGIRVLIDQGVTVESAARILDLEDQLAAANDRIAELEGPPDDNGRAATR